MMNTDNRLRFLRMCCTSLLLASAPAPALAITAGLVDDFEDGTTQQWTIGRPRDRNAPRQVASGGNPGGFLQATSTGGGGPASMLVIFNTDQWTGNYLDAEVAGIDVDFQYLSGATNLPMRIAIQGAGSIYGSSTAFSLPSDGQWHTASFGLGAEDLSRVSGPASLEQVLSEVSTVRILTAADGPEWRADAVVAQIGLDNITAVSPLPALQAGDADQDFDFDQLDLVRVQVAAKYLSGAPATWGEGDWNGAPGGSPGDPPAGDGVFNQFDIIAAQQAAVYLTGPYATIQPEGTRGDGQTSVIYHAGTGVVAVDAPAGVELTSINIASAAGVFTGDAAQNLGGSFDIDADSSLFKATFGSSFGALSFGSVAQPGLSEEFLLNDLTAVGSLAGGGDLGEVDLVYVPEPAAALLLAVGIGLLCLRYVECRV